MSIYNYYAINYNKLKKRFWEQNKSNPKLKLELEATKAQFENTSNYFKKKSCRIKQLEMVIN